MLIADIKGKLPELENWEDYLTSCVFSSFKYLGSKYLERFLQTARTLDNKSFNIAIKKPRFDFWPRFEKSGKCTEPDVAIATKKALILIEAKFYAGKSGSGIETEKDKDVQREEIEVRKLLIDQLGREYFAAKAKSSNFAVIFVTTDSVFPKKDILDTLEAVKAIKGKKEAQDAQKHIFWTKWSCAASVMEDILEEVGHGDSYRYHISAELLEFLDKRNLTEFKGFEFLSGYRNNFNSAKEKNIFYQGQPLKYWDWLEKLKDAPLKTNKDIFYL